MAEAHSAVAFSFQITHDGWDVNFDQEVLYLVWQSGLRSWKRRIARVLNSIHNGVYPGHLWSLWMFITITTAVHFSGYAVPFDIVNKFLPYIPGSGIQHHLLGCILSTLTVWLSVVYALRYTLKGLLLYHGWMYESRAKHARISLPTKLWLVAVRILSGWNKPKLYSFQGSLPRLPVPKVKDTMARYLRSIRPLVDDTDYARMERHAKEFESGIGKKLQRYLMLKSWWSTNYVSDWWEEYVYLRSRSPLMVNSNFYGIDAISTQPTMKQAARAASVIYSCLQFRRLIDRQELEPILVQGVVPLCSAQYERMFHTVRAPMEGSDKIMHDGARRQHHIAVYCKGRWYKSPVYRRGKELRPRELQRQMEFILADTSEPCPGEEKLAALTAGDRDHWARTRQMHFIKGVNRASLDAIEKAAFVVALDDIPYEYDKDHPEKLDQFGKVLLHGKGYDRWFDKSFTLCVGSNGRIGFNAEHSWADAPIMGHLWEYCIADELDNRYDKAGDAVGKLDVNPPEPIRLKWDLNQDCQQAIEKSLQVAQEIINDVDLRIYVHDHYGKGFMKKCRVSPDAYIQMALQLAYYRDAGSFSLTYEACMTRLYREGRTETVRPCTIEAAAWVHSMSDPNASVSDRISLLRKACQQHQVGYQDAMCGKGIDRHLFCLYVVARYLEVDSPFLQEVLSEPWRLSTSQTPHGQTSRMNFNTQQDFISAGGGFGPVAVHGYGVSYIIAGENTLFFHVSNRPSSGRTDCARFARKIEESLADVKKLFLEYEKLNGNKS